MEIENNQELGKFEKYFADDLQTLEEEFEKSNILFEGMNKAIERMSNSETRGAVHYLIEYYENIIELQNQKQNIIKNRINLKKIIMDYASKESSNSKNSEDSVLEALNTELNKIKEMAQQKARSDFENQAMNADLDQAIDQALSEGEE